MDPRELITLGIRILDDQQYFKKARYRTAINRIYYGLIHHIRIFKRIFNIDLENYHSDLIFKVKNLDNILGNYLGNMKMIRNDVDYVMNLDFEEEKLNQFLKIFERIKNRIEI